jgi:hypothetical protein
MYNDSSTSTTTRPQRNHKNDKDLRQSEEYRSLKKANLRHQPRQKRFTDVIDEDDDEFYEG